MLDSGAFLRGHVIAIYHATLKVFSRARGHSATAAAAYRSGTSIHDERTGQTHHYAHRAGVVDVRIFTPPDAPDWAHHPERLWNAAEAAEVRRNACVARELEVAIPAELNAAQRSALVADLAGLLVDRLGVAVMAATHAPSVGADTRAHHVHLLMTTRQVGPGGLGAKIRELDDRKSGPMVVAELRAEVCRRINAHLERVGHMERVDHRTLRAQARDAESRGDFAAAVLLTRTPQTQRGKTATAAARRGVVLDRMAQAEKRGEENQAAVTAFLSVAEQEGRLMPTPSRSGSRQAQTDRRRESAAAHVHPPVGISRSPIKLGMAQGVGSQLLNEQTRTAEETLRVQADATRDYLAQLDESLRRILGAYARHHALGIEDVRALARHCRRDARCLGLLERSQEARANWERAQTRPMRRRDAHGKTMVETTDEQRAWKRLEKEPQPKVWQRASRRQWAERRRRQRERLWQAQEREHQAAKAVSGKAMAGYAAAEREAHQVWQGLEQQRRERFPLPSDPPPAKGLLGRPSRPAPQPAVARPPQPDRAVGRRVRPV